MEPSKLDAVERAVRAAAPRAPARFADGVERRVRRRGRGWIVAVGGLTALAAALVLWLLRPPLPVTPSRWMLAAARGVSVRAPDGAMTTPPTGGMLVAGATLRVDEGGAAELVRLPHAGAPPGSPLPSARLLGGTDVRVDDDALELSAGGARLEGPEARIDSDIATVTTLGVSANIAVELRRTAMTRGNMTKRILSAALLVTAIDGGARLEAKGHSPVLLAKNDHALVAPDAPPLVTRAPVPLAAKVHPPAAKPATPNAPAPKGTATASPGADKDAIRASVRAVLGDIKTCYETALTSNEKLGGRMMVEMHIGNHNGKGRVEDAEVVPQGSDDAVAPLFEQCVLEVLWQADFPAPPGAEPLIVTYPFVFAPGPVSGQ
jgi:hypothetical protein